jgi:hypothetical protein
MTRDGTPVEWYPNLGLHVKREDLCCPGGPNFSKTRGVYAHIKNRPEQFIGVLDTRHSQGGWAVARACVEFNKQCVEFYPVLKNGSPSGGIVQEQCRALGAQLLPLKAGRSAVLYHQAKSWLRGHSDQPPIYMMPNALKLPEMVSETAAEVGRTDLPDIKTVLISASSGTIAAGVIRGLQEKKWEGTIVVHLGYSRPEEAVRVYLEKMAIPTPFWGYVKGYLGSKIQIVDEGYSYSDPAILGLDPPFPSNEFYDLKAFRWWMKTGRAKYGEALFWNIG